MEYKKNRPEDELNRNDSFEGEGNETVDAVDAPASDGSAEKKDSEELNILELLQEYLPDFAAGNEIILTEDPLDEVKVGAGKFDEAEAGEGDDIESYGYSEDVSDIDPVDFLDDESAFLSIEDEASGEDGGYPDDEDGYAFIAEEEGDGAENTVIPEESDLDATDINLMVAFGLEDELAQTMGADVAAKITEEIDAEAKEYEGKINRSVENEFIDNSQVPQIASKLKRKFKHIKIKILFGTLLTLLLMFYENLKLFGVQFGGALDPAVYPVVYIMVSLQIMLFCAAVGYEQLLSGLGDMFTGKFTPAGIAFIGNVFGVVYSVYLAETTVLPNEPVMFNSCAAAMTLFALIYDYANIKRTVLSFNIVSTKRPKYAVRYMSAEAAGIPGGFFEDGDVADGGVLRIEKTKFVDDFFARSENVSGSGRIYSMGYMFIAVIVAVLMGVYVALTGKGESVDAFGAGVVTFFATMPLSLFLSLSYPFYKGVSSAYDLDGTVLGEYSAEEYSEAGAVCFDDTDAFPSYGVKVQNIKIYNNHRIDRVLYYAASAFKVAGGPLSDVFEVATMEIGSSENVVIEAADEGYLSAIVDEKQIIFGNAEKLRELGINLPDSVTSEDDTLPVELCPMYMLRKGKLMAKLIVRYMLDSDFEFLLRDLTDEGMCACIKTFDPNIDDALITARLGGERYPFRVIRYNSADEVKRVSDRMSSGIVSRGTTKPLLSIISSCSKMLSMRKAGFTIGVVSSMIAAVIVWLLLMSGGFVSLTSGAVVLYQLLWAIPVLLTSKIFLK